MRRALALLVLVVFAGPAMADERAPVVRLVEFSTDVNPVTAARILRSIEDADRERNDLVLIELDTPGGLADTLQEIVNAILGSETPVVVWVGPSGARAASAGFLILIAADVAAMAPGTRTGAAAPIYTTGKTEKGDILQEKMSKDLAAMARSIADRRGRDRDACQQAVLSADAYTESEALELGIIDLVSKDRDSLLAELDGRTVERFDGSEIRLRTTGATIVTTEWELQQRFLEFLATPLLAYFLLLLGLVGLYVELNNPGLILPGVVGALSLLLFALAAKALPVSATGILLILLGVVMFVLEIKVTSYGMLTFGGLVSLTIGSIMLFEGPIPELRVPLVAALPASLVAALFFAVAVRFAYRAQKARVATGVEGMVGEKATVFSPLEPEGKVYVHGEIWDAVSSGGALAKGTRVRITRVDEMTLTVEPLGEGTDRTTE